MKNLLFIFLFLPTIINAQFEVDTLNQKIYFSKVYEVTKTKKETHQKVNEWIALNFKDATSVIKLNTEDKIIVKGIFNRTYYYMDQPVNTKVHFILECSIRANRYKIDLYDFTESNIYNGSTIEAPINDFFKYLTYESYVKETKKVYNEIFSQYKSKSMIKELKKEYDKKFNDTIKLKQEFNDAIDGMNTKNNKIKIHSESITNSIYEYVNKKESDDW